MPAVVFSGNNVKALKSNLDLNGVTKILSVNADPASGAGVAAPLGSIAMDYLAGKVYKKTGSLDTEWQELGSGIGGINYIENSDAESGTTGWATYADAAGAAPVDGTGGTANITWSRSTTSPLRGVADFNLVKDAVNRQGQGVSYDFTIDSADQAKILTISADYEVISGTFATGDLAVYVIQDPAGTPVVLQPAGYQVTAATIGNKVRLAATFQTASNVTSYRLCIHVASTSASAYTLAFDSIAVSPQQVVYGAPVTDTVNFTTSGSWTSNTSYSGKWKRIGEMMAVDVRVALTGAPNAAALTINLPAGFSIDTSKLNGTTVNDMLQHSSGIAVVGGTFTTPIFATYSSATAVAVRTLQQRSTDDIQTDNITNIIPGTFASGDFLDVTFMVPILGWSSSVVVSSSTDTRVVAASVSAGSPVNANNTTVIVPFGSKIVDTHAGIGVNQYTVPVPGYYRVVAQTRTSFPTANVSYNHTLSVFKNAVSAAQEAYQGDGGNAAGLYWMFGSVNTIIQCNAGDVLTVRFGTNYNVGNSNTGLTMFSAERLSGPSQIAASESVVMRAYNTGGFSVPNAAVTTITGWTKSFDTHGAFNATTGVYTVPVSGKYRISGMLLFNAAAFSVTNPFSMIAQQAGSASTNWILGETWPSASGTSQMSVGGSDIIQCNAGDTISISAYQSQGGARTLGGAATENHVDIQRIGN